MAQDQEPPILQARELTLRTASRFSRAEARRAQSVGISEARIYFARRFTACVLDVRPGFLLNDDTQDVREYAAKLGVSDEDALKKGMEVKAVEFVQKGAEIYSKA